MQLNITAGFEVKSESDVTWPSMVTHTRNLCSAFNTSKCTHTAVNTHTHTHPEQWAAIYAAAHRGAVGGSGAPQGPILRLELATFGLRVRLSNH